jgi:sugar phosphate isomerase/epimerase
MKKGIRGHDVREVGVKAICEKMKERGLEYIQLVIERSVAGFKPGGFTEELAESIKAELGDVKVAILGSYINPSAESEEARLGEIEKFKEKIRFAKILQPLAVGTETGFFGPTQSDEANDTEEAYLRVLNTLRPIVAYAKEMGVNVAIEGVSIFVINSPRKLRRLIDDLGEDNVKAIFDPVNYVRANNTDKMDAIINETFELLSDRLVAIHAKDYAINPEGKLIYPDPALGELNYKLIFENMKKYSVDIPIILEGIPDDRAEASFARLEKIKNSI